MPPPEPPPRKLSRKRKIQQRRLPAEDSRSARFQATRGFEADVYDPKRLRRCAIREGRKGW